MMSSIMLDRAFSSSSIAESPGLMSVSTWIFSSIVRCNQPLRLARMPNSYWGSLSSPIKFRMRLVCSVITIRKELEQMVVQGSATLSWTRVVWTLQWTQVPTRLSCSSQPKGLLASIVHRCMTLKASHLCQAPRKASWRCICSRQAQRKPWETPRMTGLNMATTTEMLIQVVGQSMGHFCLQLETKRT